MAVSQGSPPCSSWEFKCCCRILPAKEHKRQGKSQHGFILFPNFKGGFSNLPPKKRSILLPTSVEMKGFCSQPPKKGFSSQLQRRKASTSQPLRIHRPPLTCRPLQTCRDLATIPMSSCASDNAYTKHCWPRARYVNCYLLVQTKSS